MASAQHNWGRKQGVVHRITQKLGLGRWHFSYVDDFIALILLLCLWEQAALLLIILEIIGYPIAWKKVYVERQTSWTGLWVDLVESTLAPTDDKVEGIT